MKSVEDYFMIRGDFAYDPFEEGGIFYIRVTFIYDESASSLHLGETLKLVDSTMSRDLIEEYMPILKRNLPLLKEGLNA